jgi:hypothetical protein
MNRLIARYCDLRLVDLNQCMMAGTARVALMLTRENANAYEKDDSKHNVTGLGRGAV